MRVQTEQMEDADDTKHPEYHHATEEEERQDRQQLNNTVCRRNIPEDCHSPFLFWEKKICRPYPEDIFHYENGHGDIIDGFKQVGILRQALECLQKQHRDICDDDHRNEDIKVPTGTVRSISNLDDIEYPPSRFIQT